MFDLPNIVKEPKKILHLEWKKYKVSGEVQ